MACESYNFVKLQSYAKKGVNLFLIRTTKTTVKSEKKHHYHNSPKGEYATAKKFCTYAKITRLNFQTGIVTLNPIKFILSITLILKLCSFFWRKPHFDYIWFNKLSLVI